MVRCTNDLSLLYELIHRGYRAMDRKALLEIARSHPHLWPKKLGLLNFKTLVKNLEYAFLDKDSRYRTTAPIPSNTGGAIKVCLAFLLILCSISNLPNRNDVVVTRSQYNQQTLQIFQAALKVHKLHHLLLSARKQ